MTIGGKGRPVIGRVVLDGTPESPVDWTQNESMMLGVAPPERPGQGRFGMLRFGLGPVRLDDRQGRPVPHRGRPRGQVRAGARSQRGPRPSVLRSGRKIGHLRMPVVVPEIPGGRSNEPLDLGTITAKLFDTLKVGDLAPDFDVERIGSQEKGRRLKLSDYRGKLVLLDFWDPCGPCRTT